MNFDQIFEQKIIIIVAIFSVLLLILFPSTQARDATVMGQPVLTQQEILNWYRSDTRPEYKANIEIEELLRLYYEYGTQEGVASDWAFVQAIHETGFFHFRDGGCVLPEDNNFAGLGAWDNCWELEVRPVWEFATPEDGVLAHIHYLRAYGDPNTNTVEDLANPLPTALNQEKDFTRQWNWVINNHRENRGGPWPTWRDLGSSGWATDVAYWTKINNLYQSIPKS